MFFCVKYSRKLEIFSAQAPPGKEISVYYAIIPMPVSRHAITAIKANTGFLDFHRK